MFLKSRCEILSLFAAIFVIISFVIRTLLFMMIIHDGSLSWALALKIFGTGLFYDGVTFIYFAFPLVLCLVIAPEKIFKRRFYKFFVHCTFVLVLFLLLFDAVAEYLFFDEFGTRFNFIAVDYLVYTREVIGNIKESYPMAWIFTGLFAASGLIYLIMRSRIKKALAAESENTTQRLLYGVVYCSLFAFAFIFVDQSMRNISQNSYANELAGNGIYEFFAAFKNNRLDYHKFYPTKDERLVLSQLRDLIKEKNNQLINSDSKGITRIITNPGPERRLNVIVIVEESLSAEYLGTFGSKANITPNLDQLAEKSLLFTHIYATGTRTVRGLEALTLSIPPLPGMSIVKRPENNNLFSWGYLMRSKGYDTKFIYGGYGYFDNMNSFFSHNGFEIVDRSDFTKDEITFSNVWGVCDEDLFRKVLQQADNSYRVGKPFFSMVMTTSNHRPFTYPDGKIDIPSGSGRGGGIKYADYALGRLIEESSRKPWFQDTIFVVVADHCAGSAGKTELPVKRYEIPMLIYAPSYVKPKKVDKIASQIDVAPTVLGILNFTYKTKFFGKDILKMNADQERAFISTYQKLGFLKGDVLVILSPKKTIKAYAASLTDGSASEISPPDDAANDAIAYYQGADFILANKLNKIDRQ